MYRDIRSKLINLINKEYITDTEFISFMYDNNLAIANYDDYLSTRPINVDKELENIDNADFELCCVLITLILREDHFDNGSYDRRFEEGAVKRILNRMKVVLDL